VRATADEAGGRVPSHQLERDVRLDTDGRLKKREQGTADEQAPHDSERKEEEGLRACWAEAAGPTGVSFGLRQKAWGPLADLGAGLGPKLDVSSFQISFENSFNYYTLNLNYFQIQTPHN
jgi:hypothetical protein